MEYGGGAIELITTDNDPAQRQFPLGFSIRAYCLFAGLTTRLRRRGK